MAVIELPFDTLAYSPRAIALTYTEGDSKFYMCPFRDITGGTLVRSPGVLAKRLKETQEYKVNQDRLQKEGKSYKPLFPWDEALLKEEDIVSAFKDSIKREEDVYTLFSVYPQKAVQDMFLRGSTLSAKVKSKRRPKDTTSKHYHVSMSSPFIGSNGELDMESMYCQCADYGHAYEKGVKNNHLRCLHLSAMNSEFDRLLHNPDSRMKLSIKGRRGGEKVYQPFAFTGNYRRNEKGVYVPDNADLAALEYDALVAHYCMGGKEATHVGIDRRLYTIQEIYSHETLEAIRRGDLKREVVGQRPQKFGKDQKTVWMENAVVGQMARALSKAGYNYAGRCLELGKDVALRYEKGDRAVSIVLGEGPMYYTRRKEIGQGVIDPAGMYEDSIADAPAPVDAFSFIGEGTRVSFDDRSMSNCKYRVELPSAFRLPEGEEVISISVPVELRRAWRNEIAKKSDTERLEKKLRYTNLLIA